MSKFEGLIKAEKITTVSSAIKSLDGKERELGVRLDKEKRPKTAAFFDIDGTLAHLKPIHALAINELLPGRDPVEIHKVHVAGFKLGNSFREMDRMLGIYEDGHEEWKGPEVYRTQRLLPHQKEIDGAGNKAHERAAAFLQRYGDAAARIMEKKFKEEPEMFERAKIKPIFRLAKMYKRLGIPMGVMTANPRNLMDPITKYLGFSDYFIDISTDEDMAKGKGGKEVAIPDLVKKFQAKGIGLPREFILIGDSIRGDVGVGLRLPKEWGGRMKGIVVYDDKAALKEEQLKIQTDPSLQELVSKMDVSGLVVENVPFDRKGNPMLSSPHQDKFLTKL